MFKKKQNKEIKHLKKDFDKTQVTKIQSVINNYNQIIDVQNGYFITKNKEVTFVYQTKNIDYKLLSTSEQEATKVAYANLLINFGKRQGFNKDSILNQYVFKVPYKLEKFQETLENLMNKTSSNSSLRILNEEHQRILEINHNNKYHVLSTFYTITLPLKTIKDMYSKIDHNILTKYYEDFKFEFENIELVDFKNEAEFIQLFLCNLYKNDMKLQNLNISDSNFDIQDFINLKDSEINEFMWERFSLAKKLYVFLPNSLIFKNNYFITNSHTYNGIINISKYPDYMNDCWGDSIYALCFENNHYLENVSLKLTIDKSDSNYYGEVIGKEFMEAEKTYQRTVNGEDTSFEFLQKFNKKSKTEHVREVTAHYLDYDDLNTYINQGGLIANTYLSIRFSADSLDNFTKAKHTLLSNLKRYGFDAISFDFHTKQVLDSYLNSSKGWLHNNENIISYETLTNRELPAFLSNTITSHIDEDNKASFIGLNGSSLPVTFSMFPQNSNSRSNYCMFVGGFSGYGKSSFLKLLIKLNSSKGIKQILIDIEGEYIDLVQTLDNHLIFTNENMTINPLTPFVEDTSQHKVFLQEFFSLLINKERSSREVILLLRVWTQLIENERIDIIISDLVEEIGVIIADEQFSYSTKEPQLNSSDINILLQLKDKLTLDMNNKLFNKLFNTKTKLDVKKIIAAQSIVFDFNIFKSIADNEYTQAYSYLLVKTIDNIIYKNWERNPEQPTLLYVDEIHLYVKNNPYLLSWFNKCAGDLRKRNAGIVTATQNIKDITEVMNGENNRKIIDDVTYKVYFHSDNDSVEFLRKHFPALKNNEQIQNRIKTLVKHNAIMFLGDKIVDLRVKLSPQDFQDFGNVGK